MRLIDADALKKALKSNCDLCHDKNTNWCENCCPHNDFEDLIDNAPTVEPEKAKEGELVKAYTKGYDAGVEIARTERPQGEWVIDDWSKIIECNKCRGQAPIDITSGEQYRSNFCPICGADMRGGAE